MTRQEVTEKIDRYLAAFEVKAAQPGAVLAADLGSMIQEACSKLVATYVDRTLLSGGNADASTRA